MSNVTGTPDTSTRRYQEIIEKVFLGRYTSGATEVPFERAELTEAAKERRGRRGHRWWRRAKGGVSPTGGAC